MIKMGLAIQAISNQKVLKELDYSYVDFNKLRINLLDALQIPYRVDKYKPTMYFIKLFNISRNELTGKYQEAFVLLMQPFYVDCTLTNYTLSIILDFINKKGSDRFSSDEGLSQFYDFLTYSVKYNCHWYYL